MRVVTEDGQGNIISDVGTAPEPPKTIYPIADFLAVIKGKYRQLKAAALADDGQDSDDIEFFLYNVPMMTVVDLNNLPAWFTDGTDGMVNKAIYTRPQVDNFLEV